LARGGRPRGKAKGKAGGKAKAGRRRPGAAVRYALLGVLMHIAYDRDTDLWELMRTNSHKPGAPFRLSATMAIAVAVFRDLSHSSLRRIAGSLGEATRGACTVTYSRPCGRTSALDLGDAGWCARRRGIRIAGDNGERVRITASQHGGTGVLSRRNRSRITVTARGQYLVAQAASRIARADAVVLDGTGFAARAADAHRGTAHGGGIHKRKHPRVSFGFATWRDGRVGFAFAALGPENSADAPAFIPLAEAAKSCGAPGRGTDAIADKAYPTRDNIGWCVANGVDQVIPVMTSTTGKPRGAEWWNRHAVDNLAPRRMRRRFMRGGDVQSLPREDLVIAQAGWMERKRLCHSWLIFARPVHICA